MISSPETRAGHLMAGRSPDEGRWGMSHVRAFRMRCQRLEQRTDEALSSVVRAIGYVAAPGGATPYLALRARSPRFDRRLVDRSVFESEELAVVPFVRGFSVLAPVHDAPWLLAAGLRAHEAKVAPLRRAGLVDPRIRGRLGDAILRLLEEMPLTTDELRARLPVPLSVPLGEQGRKQGFPTHFTLALRELHLDGALVRLARERRLDRDGCVWALPSKPLGPAADRAEALEALAGRYFRAHAPASAAGFAHWADATMGEARAAIAAAGLVEVEIDGQREPWWLGPEQLDAFRSFEPPAGTRVAFVPFRDPAVSGGKDLVELLAPEHASLPFSDWRGRLVAAGGGHLVHHHFLLLAGRVAGLWEYDPSHGVRLHLLDSLPTRAVRLVEEKASELADWIREELGSACFYDGDRDASLPDLEQTVSAWQSAWRN